MRKGEDKVDVVLAEEGLDDARWRLLCETHDGVEFQQFEELKVDGIDWRTAKDLALHCGKQSRGTKGRNVLLHDSTLMLMLC